MLWANIIKVIQYARLTFAYADGDPCDDCSHWAGGYHETDSYSNSETSSNPEGVSDPTN